MVTTLIRIWLGYFTYLIWIGSLFYFFYDGYIQATSQEYMSLDSDSGSCNSVPSEVTAVYLGDNNGVWDTNPTFRSSLGTYEFEMNSFAKTSSQYSAIMNDIGKAIDDVGQGALQRDLYMNLLYWTTWEYRIPDSTSKFYFKADINTIFNKQYKYGLVASSDGYCPVDTVTTYDISTATFSLQYSYASYVASGCEIIIDPELVGFLGLTGNLFEIRVDMRAFMIASAVRKRKMTNSYLFSYYCQHF